MRIIAVLLIAASPVAAADEDRAAALVRPVSYTPLTLPTIYPV